MEWSMDTAVLLFSVSAIVFGVGVIAWGRTRREMKKRSDWNVGLFIDRQSTVGYGNDEIAP